MRIRPNEIVIDEGRGFEGTDIFNLKPFGERMLNLVKNIDHSATILLDGPWGSGKSTFVKQWSSLLQSENIPVLYFDTFENDFQENAFIALAQQIISLANQKLSEESEEKRKFLMNAKKIGKGLVSFSAKVGIRAATLGFISQEDVEDLGEVVEQVIKLSGAEFEKHLLAAIEERLTSASADATTMEAFKTSLDSLVAKLTEVPKPEEANDDDSNERPPLVFIVDELDRCKPSFALDVLETIKHLFGTDNVKFVLATNVDHLAAVVKGRYGVDVNGSEYLQKFYDLRLALPRSVEGHHQDVTQHYIRHLWEDMSLEQGQDFHRGLELLANIKNLQLRQLDRICGHIALYQASSGGDSFNGLPFAIPLVVMRLVDPDLFSKIKSGRIVYEEIETFLQLSEWPDDFLVRNFSHWWQYALLETLPQKQWVRDLQGVVLRYNLERQDIPRYVAEKIDELHFV